MGIALFDELTAAVLDSNTTLIWTVIATNTYSTTSFLLT